VISRARLPMAKRRKVPNIPLGKEEQEICFEMELNKLILWPVFVLRRV
jgi:hypothetical protein